MSAGTAIKPWRDRFAEIVTTPPNPLVEERRKGACRDAEIADLRAALEAAEHQRGALAQAIADAVTKAGMWNGEVGLTGPHLIMFCDDMASVIASQPDSERDAARWRAFVGSARISPQGSAGLENPQAENYAHMGLEIWTTFPRDCSAEILDRVDRATAVGRRWLTAYADVAVAAIATHQGEAQPLPGDKP